MGRSPRWIFGWGQEVMDFADAFVSMMENAEQSNPTAADDYIRGGLRYCGKCHTPKQTVIPFAGKELTVTCLCKCAAEAYQRDEDARKAREFRDRVERLRKDGFRESDLDKWTFAQDDGQDPRTSSIMRRYVDHFPELMHQGRGMILHGRCGSGKTFAAACVVNALIDQGYKCLMTNFSRIANTVVGMRDGKQAYLDSLNQYTLLALDDLGAERSTEYMNEIVYGIIDSRYRANLPMIITSNLSTEELKNPKDIAEQRVFNRVLERCIPVEVSKIDRRRRNIIREYDGIKEMLGL